MVMLYYCSQVQAAFSADKRDERRGGSESVKGKGSPNTLFTAQLAYLRLAVFSLDPEP